MSFNQNPHDAVDNNNSDATVGRSDLTAPYSGTGPVPSGGFAPGSRLNNNFLLEKQLGRGGMGEAWKAYDETADRYVVLKFIPKELQHIQAAVDSVRDSFRKVHELQHQHICPVYGLFTDQDHGLYLAMKFIDGITLDEYKRQQIKQNGKLSFSDTVQILWGIAKGLDYAHEKKVVHRDIKPQNVMISKKDGVQIIDFGLADEIRTSMAQFSQVVMEVSGTRPYMAPEQWRGRMQDARTDQYALAVTAYEILSGHPPFRGNDIGVLRECVLKDAPEPIAGLPKYINAALLKALAKRRDDRFSDCKSFIRALAEKPKANSQVKPQEEIVQDEVQVSIVPHLPSDKNTGETQQPAWRPQTTNSSRGSVRSSNDNPLQKAIHLAIGKPLVYVTVAVLIVVLGVAGYFAMFPSQSNDDDVQVITVKDTQEPSVIDADEPTEEIQETGWTTLFNGINLDDWNVRTFGDERKSCWKVGLLKADDTTIEVLPLAVNQTNNSDVCLINNVSADWERASAPNRGLDIFTKKTFGDCTVALDFFITKNSDSGIYLMGEYEIQITDSLKKPEGLIQPFGVFGTFFDTDNDSKNTYAEPGQWHTCRIDFVAPKFDAAGNKTANAVFKKIILDGKVVQENIEVRGTMGGNLTGKEAATGPLMLQGHCGPIAFRNIMIKENKTEEKKQILRENAGWVSIFDGKTLDGWKSNEPYEGFKVENGCIVGFGARNHLYYMEELQNFELMLDVKINKEGNSGVFVKTQWEEGKFLTTGVECQINGSGNRDPIRTGSVFSRKNIFETPHGDDEWFNYHIICRGNMLEVRINNKLVNTYEDPRVGQKGYIVLQQVKNIPPSTPMFKNILLKKLPDAAIAEQPAPKDLLSALVRGTADEVKFFLDRGDVLDTEAFAHQLPLIARYEAEGVTPLHVAAWFNPHVDVLKYLVSRGMNPHALNRDGAPALQYAARNPQVEVLKYFISLGDGNQVKYNQWIMQDAAIYNTNVEVLKYVIALGGNVNHRGYVSGTPLIFAAQRNPNPAILEYLISQGADVNAKDERGRTALDIADTDEKKKLLSEKSGWVSIFDGKTLNGWKNNETYPGFKVEDGCIVGFGKRNHLYYMEELQNFELRIDVKINKGGNSGIYIKSQWVTGNFPPGFELQVNGSQKDPQKTGSLYSLKPVYDAPHGDDEWFTYHIICRGKTLEVRINDKLLYICEDPLPNAKHQISQKGYIALQQMVGTPIYKNIFLKKLPD